MANVLGTLFGEIADAIREKSGEGGTMKPAEFPDKIAQIVTGGGGSGDLKYNSGQVIDSAVSDITTISHGLGVVPDMIIVYTRQPPVENKLFLAVGFSAAMCSKLGGYPAFMFALLSGTAVTYGTQDGFESDSVSCAFGTGYGHIHSVNDKTFNVGGVNIPMAQSYYGWFAISGILG